jgi:small GTP-binding protein
MRILNERQESLLKEERQLLNDFQLALTRFNAQADDLKRLGESINHLEELFLLVVVGEFNAGKTALINALIGSPLLKEGVTPTTTQINILKHGEEESRQPQDDEITVVRSPAELLVNLGIVDTPGTNAIIREHERITSEFVPRSDLVLFITSADRPFTESERLFMERVRDWGKKVVVIVNKIDILQNQSDLDEVEIFISENARVLLGVTPVIFLVSARNALLAKMGQPVLWMESRFEALEHFIYQNLDDISRVRLKLQNPLGVAAHLVEKYMGLVDERHNVMRSDYEMLEDVETQLKVYQEDMHRDFNYRMADIEKLLFEMEQRGDDFFDATIRLKRIFDLMKKQDIQEDFESQVIADVPDEIDKKVEELIDWLVESDLRRWQAVMEHISDRRKEHKERILGDALGAEYQYDRQRLVEEIGREAQQVVDSYDKDQEAEALAGGAQAAVAATAALEISAIGLGALVAVLATTMAADVTGILMASLLAALGLFLIPARRRQARREMHQKVAALREQLAGSLREHFDAELDRSARRINAAVAPYSRFVRAERAKLSEFQSELEAIQGHIARLQIEVELLDENPADPETREIQLG